MYFLDIIRYTYVSKLTIKMLIEGFKLQEHLQSLRCYHFMELADWADLFIMSLWNCVCSLSVIYPILFIGISLLIFQVKSEMAC